MLSKLNALKQVQNNDRKQYLFFCENRNEIFDHLDEVILNLDESIHMSIKDGLKNKKLEAIRDEWNTGIELQLPTYDYIYSHYIKPIFDLNLYHLYNKKTIHSIVTKGYMTYNKLPQYRQHLSDFLKNSNQTYNEILLELEDFKSTN